MKMWDQIKYKISISIFRHIFLLMVNISIMYCKISFMKSFIIAYITVKAWFLSTFIFDVSPDISPVSIRIATFFTIKFHKWIAHYTRSYFTTSGMTFNGNCIISFAYFFTYNAVICNSYFIHIWKTKKTSLVWGTFLKSTFYIYINSCHQYQVQAV